MAKENKNLRKEILLLKGEPVVSSRKIKVINVKENLYDNTVQY